MKAIMEAWARFAEQEGEKVVLRPPKPRVGRRKLAPKEPEEDSGFVDAMLDNPVFNNPDVVDNLSLGTKFVSLGAIVWPDPATTAGGLAGMKASIVLDVIAAIGYFNKGENISGLFSLFAAFASGLIPKQLFFQFYKTLMSLKGSGSFILIAKEAPLWLVTSVETGIDVLLEATEAVTNDLNTGTIISSAIAKEKEDKPESVDEKKIRKNIETSSREVIKNLNDIKSELELGKKQAAEKKKEKEGWEKAKQASRTRITGTTGKDELEAIVNWAQKLKAKGKIGKDDLKAIVNWVQRTKDKEKEEKEQEKEKSRANPYDDTLIGKGRFQI
jgi:hypothetical protein